MLTSDLKHNETYAIYNKRLKKFVCGTNRRCYPWRQFLSNNLLLTYNYLETAEIDMRCRQCGKEYKIVKVKIEVIE
jgi:redox-regulated HSP33 family molecular chaperone